MSRNFDYIYKKTYYYLHLQKYWKYTGIDLPRQIEILVFENEY